MKCIGMDAHSSSCTFCVTNGRGTIIDSATIETNGRLLINYVRSIKGTKKLTFEECELSNWLYGLLKNEVDDLIVCNPVANREYKRKKTDKLDAKKLAKLLRGEFLTPVFHDGSAREQLRSLMSGYEDLVSDAVRLKNRYKSLFRKEGNKISGEKLYKDESFLKDFKRQDFRFIGERVYRILCCMEEERNKYIKEIMKISKQFKEIKLLKSIPGIGNLQAPKILAQVIDPNRFLNKYKYFSYCGLVRHKRSSGGKEYGSVRIWGNRKLKCVYKMASHSILKGTSGLRKYYDYLRTKGTSDKAAKNAVSRMVAAISLSVLKNNREYNDKYFYSNYLK